MKPFVIDTRTGQKVGRVALALDALRSYLPTRAVRAHATELLPYDITMMNNYLRMNMGEMDITERRRSTRRRGRWNALAELRLKYKGESDWGNQHAGVITDFNASMQFGNGVRVMSNDPNNKEPDELKVFQDFLDYNDLNEEQGIMLGVTGELDGQALFRWSVDEKAKALRLWTVPLLETRYEVQYSDPWTPSGAILNPGMENEKTLKPSEFVFVKQRSVQNGSYGVPTSLRILNELEDLDKARADLRTINNLFARPTPVFTAKTAQDKERIKADLATLNWKIGQAFVLVDGDKFEFVTMPASTLDSLKMEIVMLIQMVSGATSVPVHFLGFPELMSNRSVADADFMPSIVQAAKAQRMWAGGLEELIPYVLAIYGKMHGRTYNPDLLVVTFPSPRMGDMKVLVETWLPVRLSKEITAQTFLTKIGVEDPDGEIEALAQEVGVVAGSTADPDEQQARVDALVALAKERQTAGLAEKDTPIIAESKARLAA